MGAERTSLLDQVCMRLAVHQPSFLPWSGLFHKALRADCFVILDSVQFPRGFTWLTRNRIKGPDGELWLTVPVMRKGLGLQRIDEVRVMPDPRWRRKHMETFRHCYREAPFFDDTFGFLADLYDLAPTRLVEWNLAILDHFWNAFGVGYRYKLLSSTGVEGRGTGLLASICEALGADTLVATMAARHHLDLQVLEGRGMRVEWIRHTPPVYPQLWGDFCRDLSAIDLIFTYGPHARRILERSQKDKGNLEVIRNFV